MPSTMGAHSRELMTSSSLVTSWHMRSTINYLTRNQGVKSIQGRCVLWASKGNKPGGPNKDLGVRGRRSQAW